MKYQSKIVGLGPDALAFLEDEDMNFIIIFNEDAPQNLQNYRYFIQKLN